MSPVRPTDNMRFQDLPEVTGDQFLSDKITIFFDPNYECDPEVLETYKACIESAGAQITYELDETIDYVITKYQDGPIHRWVRRLNLTINILGSE